MDKEAKAATTILKTLGYGTLGAGALGGAGYVGHQAGFRTGANRTANAMASTFSKANEIENQQIADSFKAFNQKENKALAADYFKKGISVGAHLKATGRLGEKTAKGMSKKAYLSEIYDEVFQEELSKNAGARDFLIRQGAKLGKSFSEMGKGLSSAGKDFASNKTGFIDTGANIVKSLTNAPRATALIAGTAGGIGTAGYVAG